MIKVPAVTYEFDNLTVIVTTQHKNPWKQQRVHFRPRRFKKLGKTLLVGQEEVSVEERIEIVPASRGTTAVTAKTGNWVNEWRQCTPSALYSVFDGIMFPTWAIERRELLAVCEGILTQQMLFDWDYHEHPFLLAFFEAVDAAPQASADEVRAMGARARLRMLEELTERARREVLRHDAPRTLPALPAQTTGLFGTEAASIPHTKRKSKKVLSK